MICPAFQSSFILDDSVRQVMFSPFNPDSIPKPVNGHLVDKKQWGIVVTMSNAEKESSFRTVDMETVFPPETPNDSIQTGATSPNAVPPLLPQDSLVNN